MQKHYYTCNRATHDSDYAAMKGWNVFSRGDVTINTGGDVGECKRLLNRLKNDANYRTARIVFAEMYNEVKNLPERDALVVVGLI